VIKKILFCILIFISISNFSYASEVIDIESGKIVRNYIIDKNNTRDVYLVSYKNMELIIQLDLDGKKQKITIGDVTKILPNIPDKLISLVNKIIVVDYNTPLEEEYKIDIVATTTISKGIITFYENSKYQKSKVKNYIDFWLYHEIGHLLDKSLSKEKFETKFINSKFIEKGMYSLGKEWTNAMIADEPLAKRRYISPYAKKFESNAEDFAESIALYLTGTKIFMNRSPNRVKIIEKLLEN
jgi:hypothetical protein